MEAEKAAGRKLTDEGVARIEAEARERAARQELEALRTQAPPKPAWRRISKFARSVKLVAWVDRSDPIH